MSIEQLFFVAIFLAIALFNFLRQMRNRRRRDGAGGAPPGEEPRGEEPAAAPPRVLLPPPRVVITPPVAERRDVPRLRQSAAEPRRSLAAPAARPPRASRRLLRSHRDARRGIVLITVLGPCRGLEPLSTPEGPATAPISPR
jgi:hypothetical protein